MTLNQAIAADTSARKSQSDFFKGVHLMQFFHPNLDAAKRIGGEYLRYEHKCPCGGEAVPVNDRYLCSKRCGHEFFVALVTDDERLRKNFPKECKEGHIYAFATKARPGFPEQCRINGTVRIKTQELEGHEAFTDFDNRFGVVQGCDMAGNVEVLTSCYWESIEEIDLSDDCADLILFKESELEAVDNWFEYLK